MYLVNQNLCKIKNNQQLFLNKKKSQSEPCLFLSGSSKNRKVTSRPVFLHQLVYTEEKRLRKCVYCNFKNARTYSGHAVTSYFQCQACGVALCKTMRNCFSDFHKHIEERGWNDFYTGTGSRRLSGSLIKSEPLITATVQSDSISSIETGSHETPEYTYCISLSSPESQ